MSKAYEMAKLMMGMTIASIKEGNDEMSDFPPDWGCAHAMLMHTIKVHGDRMPAAAARELTMLAAALLTCGIKTGDIQLAEPGHGGVGVDDIMVDIDRMKKEAGAGQFVFHA